ncbi:globin-2 A chain-like isoform X1 [Cylas formicarius]|uniref:globin-2 A chain-like isoform X1 n=1 Tax=Cylas formicarius TaxID=197179 RepID=UPI002958BEEA|nr:globin-2 A chain-like isoform X1 [Cylas formicarius]XP_060521327.1 globin-2 A chain-like isoform X1 [Cylas formicarius]XP_060521328.1 globin-2 A chain-like isoform X1 [Cylas formicarius]XP_060521330.1 globin-2 A chain-like isoform X1 [Cylas formicarius]XP_060521331.1 globin-2 A chain-like isoform X1 [Cylas formicarius]XP_060521332.1 globin-2 A chain-like isoform X1 [Cylas formicarius]
MGLITSLIWRNNGRTDDPDPDTGLTSRDRYLLKSTWQKLSKDSAATGIQIFLNLFEKEPKYHDLFPFRDIPWEDLPSCNRFKAHCVTLMYAFSSIIGNIEQPHLLRALLVKQAVAHVPRKVPDKAYWQLKEVLMEMFKPIMTNEELATWNKFLDLGLNLMVEAAGEARKNDLN